MPVVCHLWHQRLPSPLMWRLAAPGTSPLLAKWRKPVQCVYHTPAPSNQALCNQPAARWRSSPAGGPAQADQGNREGARRPQGRHLHHRPGHAAAAQRQGLSDHCRAHQGAGLLPRVHLLCAVRSLRPASVPGHFAVRRGPPFLHKAIGGAQPELCKVPLSQKLVLRLRVLCK